MIDNVKNNKIIRKEKNLVGFFADIKAMRMLREVTADT